jgi:hypothetical protein
MNDRRAIAMSSPDYLTAADSPKRGFIVATRILSAILKPLSPTLKDMGGSFNSRDDNVSIL